MMSASCSICENDFFCENGENILSTKCGHVYHGECLNTWLMKSKTCPLCRAQLNDESVFKLNLWFEAKLTKEEKDCRKMIRDFVLWSKDKEINHLKELYQAAIKQNEELREKIEKLEAEIQIGKEVERLRIDNSKSRLKDLIRIGSSKNEGTNDVGQIAIGTSTASNLSKMMEKVEVIDLTSLSSLPVRAGGQLTNNRITIPKEQNALRRLPLRTRPCTRNIPTKMDERVVAQGTKVNSRNVTTRVDERVGVAQRTRASIRDEPFKKNDLRTSIRLIKKNEERVAQAMGMLSKRNFTTEIPKRSSQRRLPR